MRFIKQYININFNRKNKQRAITFGYAAAIVFAFLLSLANNTSNVSASVSHKDTFDQLLLESSISDTVSNTDSIYPDASVSNIKSLFEMVYFNDKEKTKPLEVVVEKGDNIISILSKVGMEYAEANAIANSLKKVFDLRALKIGQKIVFTMVVDPRDDSFLYVKDLMIPARADERFIVERDENAEYVSRAEKDELIQEVNNAAGSIDGTLSHSMNIQGVPNRIVAEFISIFSFSIDFRRDVRKGDKFEIIYENYINPDGQLVKSGDILYASLTLRNQKIALYKYKDSKGVVDYFDEKGYAMKKTLHRKPLALQTARVSSPYGSRYHPILKQRKVHWGIDYAAPKGTAIFAAGDGVVQMAKWNGAYGNYVKIRHNSEYSTAYGHMSRIAKGIKPGMRVKQGQVIAYVGSTGRSTGPHLHYEVIQNGRRINPTTVKASASENLKGGEFDRFKKEIAAIKENHKSLFADFATDKIASKE